MGITWQQGHDSLGYNWLSALEDGCTRMQPVYWKDGDSPERFRHLAGQTLDALKAEREQLKRLTFLVGVHELQAQAFQAISEVLATGQAITVIIEPLEPVIQPQKPGDA